jgi:hypothetical protein
MASAMNKGRFVINKTLLVCLFVAIITTGCDRSWHSKMNWNAKDFFDDPLVVALCKAIETNDLEEIDRLVADGADINAKGKGNMTPLLWAFPEGKPKTFKRILEHGADPNVKVTDDFNTEKQVVPKLLLIRPGDSVLHLAAKTSRPNYFRYVIQHGGDPNLIGGGELIKRSPLSLAVMSGGSDKKQAIQLLIDAGADLDYVDSTERTALSYAISSGHYDLAIQLLNLGASFNVCNDSGDTVIHFILREGERLPPSQELKEKYSEVLELLKSKGADFEGAKRDRKVWASGGNLSPGRIAELKKRYAGELAAKQAAKEQKEENEQ